VSLGGVNGREARGQSRQQWLQLLQWDLTFSQVV